MNKRNSTRILTEAGIMIAFGTILSLIKVYQAPFGGSVTAGSMIPIIIFALRWGVVPTLLTGVVFGIMQFVVEPVFLTPVQFVFDYLIAFGLLALAGIAKNAKDNLSIGLGVLLAILGRFVAHFIAGVVFWGRFAPEGLSPVAYSLLYNGGYLLPEFIISVVLILFLYKPLNRILQH